MDSNFLKQACADGLHSAALIGWLGADQPQSRSLAEFNSAAGRSRVQALSCFAGVIERRGPRHSDPQCQFLPVACALQRPGY
jgi:hypothetical protein